MQRKNFQFFVTPQPPLIFCLLTCLLCWNFKYWVFIWLIIVLKNHLLQKMHRIWSWHHGGIKTSMIEIPTSFFYSSPSLSNHPLFFDLWFMIYDNFPRTLSVCQRGHFSGNPSLTSFQSSLPIINNWSPSLLEVSSPLLHADNADDQGRQQQQAPAHAEPEDGKVVVVVVVGRLSKGEVSQEINR